MAEPPATINRVDPSRLLGGLLPEQKHRPLWQWAAFGTLLVVFCASYFFFADLLIRQTNQDRSKSDQQNCMRLALAQSRVEFDADEGWVDRARRMLPHETDGVVNPLWPWVASQFAGEDEASFFKRGKWINVGVTGIFVILLGIVVFTRFSFFAALNVVLLSGFVVFLPRAVFFQPEALFYILFFLCWLCCLSLLRRHSLGMYFTLGVLGGLAYLAKSSVQPLLMAFAALMIFLLVEQSLFKTKINHDRSWGGTVVGLLLMASMFLIVCAPRMTTSNERWGSAFHSYPAYWMWMDDFDQGITFKVKHPDAAAINAMKSEDKPSLGNYWRDHSGEQTWRRLADGFWKKTSLFAAPKRIEQKKKAKQKKPWKHLLPQRGLYLGALVVFFAMSAVGISVFRKGRSGALASGCRSAFVGPALIFTCGSALLFALAYGWYSPIGRGDRFMMSIYLPLAFTLILAGERMMDGSRDKKIRMAGAAAHFALGVWIVSRLIVVARHPYFQDSV